MKSVQFFSISFLLGILEINAQSIVPRIIPIDKIDTLGKIVPKREMNRPKYVIPDHLEVDTVITNNLLFKGLSSTFDCRAIGFSFNPYGISIEGDYCIKRTVCSDLFNTGVTDLTELKENRVRISKPFRKSIIRLFSIALSQRGEISNKVTTSDGHTFYFVRCDGFDNYFLMPNIIGKTWSSEPGSKISELVGLLSSISKMVDTGDSNMEKKIIDQMDSLYERF